MKVLVSLAIATLVLVGTLPMGKAAVSRTVTNTGNVGTVTRTTTVRNGLGANGLAGLVSVNNLTNPWYGGYYGAPYGGYYPAPYYGGYYPTPYYGGYVARPVVPVTPVYGGYVAPGNTLGGLIVANGLFGGGRLF